jgi:S-adenosylmethionine decarboxylase
MKPEMTSAAVYRLIVVAHGCRGELRDDGSLLDLARNAATASGLQVVAHTAHAFVPHGLSVALILAQSHLVISTWPEHATATVDLAVCAEREAAHAAWQVVRRHLHPADIEPWEKTIALGHEPAPHPRRSPS